MKKINYKLVNTISLFVLLFFVCLISVGYSAVNSSLSISGDLEYEQREMKLYDRIQSLSSNSSNGVHEYIGSTSTFKGDKKVYYYNILGPANNNVIFANYCWKIVRTTDTGGVKILYNGTPTTDGKCNGISGSTLSNSQMQTSSPLVQFNNNNNLSTHTGYMYGNTDLYTSNSYGVYTMTPPTDKGALIFGDGFDYKNGMYNLKNSKYVGISKEVVAENRYACRGMASTCSTLIYILFYNDNLIYYTELTNGTTPESLASATTHNITFGDGIKYSNGFYKLNNPTNESISTTMIDRNHFTCRNLTSDCDDIIYVTNYNGSNINYIELTKNREKQKSKPGEGQGSWIYGTGFSYDNNTGKFNLDNPKNVNASQEVIDNYHFACIGMTTSCDTLLFLYAYNNGEVEYTKLDNSSIESMEKSQFYSNTENRFSNNSTIKRAVDTWYLNNMTKYSSYLEDTVWCNDTSINYAGLGNPLGNIYFNANLIGLTCGNKEDRFTVNESNGNGALTYPVGLVTQQEIMMTYNDRNTSLGDEDSYWTMTPHSYVEKQARVFNGRSAMQNVNNTSNVKPAVSLNADVKYKFGNGSEDTPYVIV